MNELEERVTKAIESYFSSAEKACKEHIDCARSAIKAMREPTEAMIEVGNSWNKPGHAKLVWTVMIDEALRATNEKS